MPPKNPWQYDVNQLNNKGLDVIHPIEQVEKDFYSRMEDVKSLQEGTITPRPGTSLINAIAFASGSFTELSQSAETLEICVTVGGAVDTYGTPVEFFAAAGFNAKWMTLSMAGTTGPGEQDGTFEFDIVSGPALTTIEVAERLLIQNPGGGIVSHSNTVVSFPVDIAAGTRIGIQIKDVVNDLDRSQCFVMHIYG